MVQKRAKTGGAGGVEYISLDGLRQDGRRVGEVRKIRSAAGALPRADGSAYFEQGNTRVLAAVYGPREAPKGRAPHDKAVVVAEFSSAAFAAPGRRRTRRGDRRSMDAAALIKAVFEGVILTKVLAKTQIDIYIQVLQDDGGTIPAAINAASIALVNAGVPMMDVVVACSVGYVDEQFVVDLNSAEAGGDGPELTLAVLGHTGMVSSFQLESRMPNVDVFERAMEEGTAACNQIFTVLKYELTRQALKLLDSRGVVAF